MARPTKRFQAGAPRLAEPESSDRYGNGRRGVWNPNLPNPMVLRWKRQVWRAERQVRTMVYYPSKNGFNDPLTITCLLDLLIRMEPATFLNAPVLVDFLEDEYPQIVWDAVTVGRIMKALVEEAAITERPNNQPAPIIEYRYSDGRVYMINPSPGNHYWLCQLREYFGRCAEKYARDLRGDEPPSRDGQIWADVTTLPWGEPPGV